MLGVLCPGAGKLRAVQKEILGLRVLWVDVPTGGFWERSRVLRAERLLKRCGVRRLLPVREMPDWKLSLPAVEPLPLYRALAAEQVLTILKRKGLAPEKSVVALVGERVDEDLASAARTLCPQVHTLLIRTAYGGERLTQELYREFGAAAVLDGRADVQVRFSGEPTSDELVLCGRVRLLGLEPELPGVNLPEMLKPEPFLTALWQCGRIAVKEIRLRDKNGDFGCDACRNMV